MLRERPHRRARRRCAGLLGLNARTLLLSFTHEHIERGAFQQRRIAALFRDASIDVPEHIRAFVAQAIENYPRG
jgi:hypothetical protein